MKQRVLHTQLKLTETVNEFGDKTRFLGFRNKSSQAKFDAFIGGLQENQVVDVFYDAHKDDGTLAQLAKIHKCIREIAIDTGNSFEDIKLEVKRKAGMCIKKTIEGEVYMVCKSFGDASKEELGLVINTIIELGDMANINFR